MDPQHDNQQLGQGGGEPSSSRVPAQTDRGGLAVPSRQATPAQREAATNVIRSQIDSLYGDQPVAAAATQPEPASAENPYERTRAEEPGSQAEQWNAYHTAWQNYYQKYYEAYYTHQVKQTKASSEDGYFSQRASAPEEPEPTVMTKEEALTDLRRSLLQRVASSAKKIRRSRHFIPILAGTLIVLIFVFIQYNEFFVGTVMAYVSPGSLDVQNIVVDPTTDVQVGPDPLLIIPKINVDVPVSYDIGNDYNSQMAAMKNGLAWFGIPGADSHPGQVGNTVLAGHSSNDLFDTGDYKFIFAQLDKLGPGDTIYANYKGIRYTYVVDKTQVVSPTDVSALVYPTTKPILTLLTCTPLGTSLNRLLVIAEQVNPDPTSAAKPTDTTNGTASTISGANAPSLFEKLFGAGG